VPSGDVDHAHVEDASDRYVGGHVRVPGDVKIRTGRVGSRDAYAEAGVDHVQCDVRCGADEGRLVGTLKVKEAVGGHFFLLLREVKIFGKKLNGSCKVGCTLEEICLCDSTYC